MYKNDKFWHNLKIKTWVHGSNEIKGGRREAKGRKGTRGEQGTGSGRLRPPPVFSPEPKSWNNNQPEIIILLSRQENNAILKEKTGDGNIRSVLTKIVFVEFLISTTRPVGRFFCGGFAIQRRDGLNVRQGREPLGKSGGMPYGKLRKLGCLRVHFEGSMMWKTGGQKQT